jgi:hypothetical protein
MIAISDVERYLDKRVVLTCDNNVSYAGVVRGSLLLEGKQGLVVRLDSRSCFSIWCPLDFIKGLLVIPITADNGAV